MTPTSNPALFKQILSKISIAVQIVLILLSMHPAQSAQAANYVDRFSEKMTGPNYSTTTGTADTGLRYSCENCMMYGNGYSLAVYPSGYSRERSLTITSRDGKAFTFDSTLIYIGDPNTSEIWIEGSGPEPFTIHVSGTHYWDTLSAPAGGNLVTKVVISSVPIYPGFSFVLDDFDVELDIPAIRVLGNGRQITNGDTSPASSDDTLLGSSGVAAPISKEFTIRNIGDADLDLTGSPFVSVSGAPEISVISQPSSGEIPVGGEEPFTIQCNPSREEIFTSTVSISTNSIINPYTFEVSCTGIFDPPNLTSFSLQLPASSPTHADSLIFRAAFDEAVQGVDQADFSVNSLSSAVVSGVSEVSPNTYDITVSGGDLDHHNGSVNLDLAASQDITDMAGLALAPGEPGLDESYILDNSAPVPEIDLAAGQNNLARSQPINFRIDFGEPVSGFDSSDLIIGGSAPGIKTGTVAGGPQSYNVGITGLTGDGTLLLDLISASASDAAGNSSTLPSVIQNQVNFDGDPDFRIRRSGLTTIANGGVDALGVRTIGTTSLTYTIDNSDGADQLTISSITASNYNNTRNFLLGTDLPITIAGGEIGTFTASFEIEVNGVFNLDIEIMHNDASENPFQFTLNGIGTGGSPNISVQRPTGAPIPAGGNDTLTSPSVGTLTLNYEVSNSAGTEQLVITSISPTNLDNISSYTLLTPLPLQISPNGSELITFTFDTADPGDFNLDLAISSNDPVNNIYGFQIYGTASILEVVMGSGTTPLDGEILLKSPPTIEVGFNKTVQSGTGSGAADNPFNYLLVRSSQNGIFNTVSCAGGAHPADIEIAINDVSYHNLTHTASLQVNGGLPLLVGKYRLLVCGTTSIQDLYGTKLNRGQADTEINFTISNQQSLPLTGFQPDQETVLPVQPSALAYTNLHDLWLEIPTIDVQQNIVGVPESDVGWDVTWLGDDIGYLAGTAFPTWAGNTGLTGHSYGSDGLPGPFADLHNLKWGEVVIIHFSGQKYIYQVQVVDPAALPSDIQYVNQHEEYDWVTLITCMGFDEISSSYRYRTIVKAVLIAIEAD